MGPTTASLGIERLEQQAGRVQDVVRILAKYEVAGWLSAIPYPKIKELLQRRENPEIRDLCSAERVRLALTELGTTYIKVGQMMSTRADIVGPELALELSKLQSHTPPDSYDEVKRCVEEELGRPIDQIFSQFDPEAFACASIAQVHRAVLPSGELVAVKVQKVGVQKQVEVDLSILESLAVLVEEHMTGFKAYAPIQLVAEFKKSILNELDFSRERRNLDRFNNNFADEESVQFPHTYSDFCGRRVLTMDFMDGILCTDAARLQASAEDLNEFARRGATVYLDMVFRDSFYHADPHPGNLMLLAGDVVGILDCGMVGRLDAGLHDDFESLMLAVSQNDAETLTDTLWKLSAGHPSTTRDSLRSELSDLLEETTQGAISEIDLSGTLNSLATLIRKYKIGLRPGLTGLLKTLVLLEGTARQLNPKFSLAEVMHPYYERILMERFSPKRWGRKLQRSYRDWDLLFQTFPRDVNQTMQQVQSGKLQVRLDHRHLDLVVNRLVLGIIVSALLLGSSLMWSLSAPPLFHHISIFGAGGFFLSMVLSWKLYRAIHQSGNVSSDE